MTLQDIRTQIVGVLSEGESFSTDDFKVIEIQPDLEEHREKLIRTVLGDLCEAGMLRAITPSGHPADANLWVLTAPFGSAGQDIPVSLTTSTVIADEINAYIDGTGVDWPRADPLNLQEGNLLMLVGIITDLRGDVENEGAE